MNKQKHTSKSCDVTDNIDEYVELCLKTRSFIKTMFTIIFVLSILLGITLMFIGLIFENVVIRSLIGLLIRFYGLLLFSTGLLFLLVLFRKEKQFMNRIINLVTLSLAFEGVNGVLKIIPFSLKHRNKPSFIRIMRITSFVIIVNALASIIITLFFVSLEKGYNILSINDLIHVLHGTRDIVSHLNALQLAMFLMMSLIPLVVPLTYIALLFITNMRLNKLNNMLDDFKVKIKLVRTRGSNSIEECVLKIDNSEEILLTNYVKNVLWNVFDIGYITRDEDNKIDDMYLNIFSQSMIMFVITLAPYIAYSIEEKDKEKKRKVVNTLSFIIAISEILKTHNNVRAIYDSVSGKDDKREDDPNYHSFVRKLLNYIQRDLGGSTRMIRFDTNTPELMNLKYQLVIELACRRK